MEWILSISSEISYGMANKENQPLRKKRHQEGLGVIEGPLIDPWRSHHKEDGPVSMAC
jgi:hypothetical protein